MGVICTMLCGAFGYAIADDLGTGFIDSFKSFNPNAWVLAEYDFSHPHFDTDWKKENAIFGANDDLFNTGLILQIKPHPEKSPVGNKFSGASVRRVKPTHYGRYESWIKPAVGAGFVTGFFTYTGPHYGTQHDEIDMEFLGGNTREIHIAWFQNGKLKNKFIELPFDAADKPRLYAFEWLPDRINWFVESKLVFTINQKQSLLPKTPSMLFANVWAADHSIADWSGKTQPNQSGDAWFSSVKFTPYKPEVNLMSQVASMMTTTKESDGLELRE